jgi:hypothetical protein
MSGSPVGVVFCRHTNADFKACNDGSCVRAIGNITPEYPNEELWLKHCQAQEHPVGTCEHQTVLGRLPTVPIYFFKVSGDGQA